MAEQNANPEGLDKVKDFLSESTSKISEGASDLAGKAKQAFEDNKDKVEGALKSDKAEEISDNVLDAVSGFAKKVLGDQHSEKVDEIRNKLDDSIGNE